MQKLDKIKAIQALRAKYGWDLAQAKLVCDIVEQHIYTNAVEADSAIRKAENAAECAREDLRSLVRLTDFLASRPNEYAAWKRERGL